MSPDTITVTSAGLGPLRLTLAMKRPSFEALMAAKSGQSGIQSSELTARKTRSANHSQATYTIRSYDVYREPQPTEPGVPRKWMGLPLIPEGCCIPKNPQRQECVTLAKAWLHDCLQKHAHCKTHTIPELPRRVIDVREGEVRLVVPEYGTRGHWIALSHCWGKTIALKTTPQTLWSHRCGIEWNSLPQTFKDAVLVTRALEVPYLWIDSLCIIQDDGGSDFHAEAAKMSDIYRDSILTIAASCSASDSAGFLQDRLVGDDVELAETETQDPIHVRQAIDHSRMIRNDPIHARAWTFQETILPHRLLSFGSHEASWECETLRKCECGQIENGIDSRTSSNELGRAAYRQYTREMLEGRIPVGKKFDLPTMHGAHLQSGTAGPSLSEPSVIPERYANRGLAHTPAVKEKEAYRGYIEMARQRLIGAMELIYAFIPKRERLGTEDIPACAEELRNVDTDTPAVKYFYRYWRRVLVPEYTRRALSKDSDRLIALQAIASDIHSVIQDRYLAGLWEGDLINQLCWQSADGRGVPADNESPSWSWSSIRGPTTPHLAEEFENSKSELIRMIVVNAECSLAGKSPCGRILNGSITLHALAMEVRYAKDRETGRFGFYAQVLKTDHPKSMESVPLRMKFSPDTPLGCQRDGSLSRSAKRTNLSTGYQEHAMTAMLLLVKCSEIRDCCVLVCGLVPAAPEPNTCHRLGIGTIHRLDFRLVLSCSFRQRFVLI